MIPAYNPRADHLARAVASVERQTLETWRCVIVDDGSTTPVSVFDDPRISVVRKANGGVASARNHGVGRLDCRYIAFLDQDDEFLPEKLERQVRFMEENDLAMSDTLFTMARDGVPLFEGFEDHDGRLHRLLEGGRMGLSTLVVRSDAFARVGGFDESLQVATDWDLQLRIAEAEFRFDRLRDPMGWIHLHGANASDDYRAMYGEQVAILRRYLRHPDPEIRDAAARGLRRLRTLHVHQALDLYRERRQAADLLWAAREDTRLVARSVQRKLFGGG